MLHSKLIDNLKEIDAYLASQFTHLKELREKADYDSFESVNFYTAKNFLTRVESYLTKLEEAEE